MKKPKEPPLKTREQIITDLINHLAGFEHQLGTGTHLDDMETRAQKLLSMGAKKLSAEELRTLENFRLWLDRTRKAIGPWRLKFQAMKPSLFAVAATERKKTDAHGVYH